MTISQVCMYLKPTFDEEGRPIKRRGGKRIQRMSMAEAREFTQGKAAKPSGTAKAQARAKAIEMGKALAAKKKKRGS